MIQSNWTIEILYFIIITYFSFNYCHFPVPLDYTELNSCPAVLFALFFALCPTSSIPTLLVHRTSIQHPWGFAHFGSTILGWRYRGAFCLLTPPWRSSLCRWNLLPGLPRGLFQSKEGSWLAFQFPLRCHWTLLDLYSSSSCHSLITL